MIAIILRNEEEVVFSASSASEGGHATLAHIPGAALWGALAARVYSGGKKADTFEWLHSGKVRISPGFPVTQSGGLAFPLPQTFQGPKHERDKGIERITANANGGHAKLTAAMRNSCHRDVNAETDHDAHDGNEKTERVALDVLMGWYVAADGSMVKPNVRERGKAATDPGARRVLAGQFFQYEHLQPHQDWLVWIDADDTAIEQELAGELTKRPLVLGRSKRREFGGTFFAKCVENWVDPRQAQFLENAQGELILWCLSDLALVDGYGTPNLAPEPADFGIAGFTGRLHKTRSAINSRRYAPFNTFLRAGDREHAVIAAGSVLIYRLDQPLDRSLFRHGLGLWRERGLGLVWPDAPMLLASRPHKKITDVAASGFVRPLQPRVDHAGVTATSNDQIKLLDSLREYANGRRDARLVADAAVRLKKTLISQLRNAEKQGGETPGSSQWSEVAQQAKRSRTVADLDHALLKDSGEPGQRGCCVGPANRNWDTMRKQLRQMIDSLGGIDALLKPDERRERVFLHAFARAARGLARESDGMRDRQ